MKSNITLLALTLLAFALFFSCSKKTESNQYSMTALVNNNYYTAPNCQARLSAGTMVIEGLTNNSSIPEYPYIELRINNWHEAIDTFRFDSAMYHGSGTIFSYSGNHTSSAGLVFINTITSTSISGTFQFTCADSTFVTGGTFIAKKKI